MTSDAHYLEVVRIALSEKLERLTSEVDVAYSLWENAKHDREQVAATLRRLEGELAYSVDKSGVVENVHKERTEPLPGLALVKPGRKQADPYRQTHVYDYMHKSGTHWQRLDAICIGLAVDVAKERNSVMACLNKMVRERIVTKRTRANGRAKEYALAEWVAGCETYKDAVAFAASHHTDKSPRAGRNV